MGFRPVVLIGFRYSPIEARTDRQRVAAKGRVRHDTV
jgi:hypothetical protein